MLKDLRDVYILGKSLHYPIALEGALKIKELTYIHAEGIAFGELKHGPLALIDSNSIVIVINPSDISSKDVLSNVHEIKSEAPPLLGFPKSEDVYDHFIKLPTLDSIMYPIIEIIPPITGISSCPKEKRRP